MAETDPKSVQDLTNVVSRARDGKASISYSSLARMLTMARYQQYLLQYKLLTFCGFMSCVGCYTAMYSKFFTYIVYPGRPDCC